MNILSLNIKNISLRNLVVILAGVMIAALLLVAVTATTKMASIGTEIEALAERDIPLTEIVTKITAHQLEQSINFERALRFGEEMRREEKAAAHFKKAMKTSKNSHTRSPKRLRKVKSWPKPHYTLPIVMKKRPSLSMSLNC